MEGPTVPQGRYARSGPGSWRDRGDAESEDRGPRHSGGPVLEPDQPHQDQARRPDSRRGHKVWEVVHNLVTLTNGSGTILPVGMRGEVRCMGENNTEVGVWFDAFPDKIVGMDPAWISRTNRIISCLNKPDVQFEKFPDHLLQ